MSTGMRTTDGLQAMSSSSSDEDRNENAISFHGSKKRRVQRACDICRRKKVRCDGGQMPGYRCTNCINHNHECTYMEAAKKRCPPKSYVEALENRVVRVEKYLRDHCPDTDLTQELGLPFDKETWLAQGVDKLDSPCPPRRTTLPAVQPLPLDKTDDPDHSDEELVGRHSLEHHIKKMTVDPGQPRFFGKSSTIMFVQSAIDLKHGINKNDEVNNKIGIDKLPSKRPEFWKPHPWVLETLEHETRHIYFPEKDLMESLIDLYFTRSGLYLPIFHRPTFERDVRVGLHIHDQGFGSVVLLVCALGARFSNDPRVLLEGIKDQHSAGWKWFRQVHWVRRSLLVPPRLSDLQIASLTAIFLHGSSTPQSSWTAIGMGIRLAQDVGAHRRKVYGSVPTVEEELWKRAFWVLVTLDRFISSNLGRSCAIHDEDFDLDLPVECDDEYWINEEDPKLAFKQPPGKPSIVAYFNCHLRLNMIHAFALRTIYSINKSKVLLGFVGHQWEKRIVAELDSALSKWMDSVPSHLRWDPDQESLPFFNQSASLYASYYNVQICVHRPFIPSPLKSTSLSFASLSVCTNAARSCVHILDVQFRRCDTAPNSYQFYRSIMPLFTAGIVLLLDIWGSKMSGSKRDSARKMVDVHAAMKVLKGLEGRWHTAGRLWDIMYELANVADSVPLPAPSRPPISKRERSSDSSLSTSSPMGPYTASGFSSDTRRLIAGSMRVSSAMQQQTVHPSSQNQSSTSPSVQNTSNNTSSSTGSSIPLSAGVSLPMNSGGFGGLPLYTTFGAGSTITSGNNGWLAGALNYTHPGSSQIQPAPKETIPAILPEAMLGQSFDFNHRSSTLVHDQEIVNQAASLPSTQSPFPQYLPSIDPQQASLPIENFDDLIMSLGSDGAMFEEEHGVPSIWSTAPTGFEWDDWATYVNNLNGISKGAQNAPSVQYESNWQ